MSNNQIYCVIDYETFSECDLKKAGAYEYSVHPSTEVLCVAWRMGTKEQLKSAKSKSWFPITEKKKEEWGIDSDATFGELFRAFSNPSIILVAHNAYFEQVITKNVFSRYMPSDSYRAKLVTPPSRWICTASLAAALAFPRSLEGSTEALGLKAKKDMEGNDLIKKWCKPKRASKKDSTTRYTDKAGFLRILKYCENDIEAEVGLFLALPPLTENERKVWLLDQKINLNGFQVDRALVYRALELIETEKSKIEARTREISYGVVETPTKRDKVLTWLAEDPNPLLLPDLRKKTVEKRLKDGGFALQDQEQMLEERHSIAKTSTAKYKAFEIRSRSDSRVRDILLYSAASTGRWGGRGVQPQNFPRGTLKDTAQAIDVILNDDIEMLRMLYGDPMEVFSSCLRGVITASEGKELFVADYAAIEARVLFWVARHEEGLQAFIENRDLYKEMASRIYRVETDDVTPLQRQVGKGVVLGCGYQMGAKKFQETCKSQEIEISKEIAEEAVRAYRETHHPVASLWKKTQQAAIWAVMNPGRACTQNRAKWWVKDNFLWCELPSKRRLAYFKPSVLVEKTPWGEPAYVLYHYGVNSLTKKWECSKTYGGRLVENVIQAISRDLMAEAMLRIDATGRYDIILSVHDELIAEADPNLGSVKEFENLMAELPIWAEGLPLKAEGWSGYRYRK